MSAAREAILGRIRAALTDVQDTGAPHQGRYRLAADGDPVARFAERAAEYRADAVRVPEERVGEVISTLVAGRVGIPADLPAEWRPDGVALETAPLTTAQLDALDAVVTGCALAIAETGTVVLDGGPAQGTRAMTLVPDHHVCVVRASQVVGTVPEAIRLLGAVVRERRAALTFVSGPSATSDIELQRVEGVHGPRRLNIVILG